MRILARILGLSLIMASGVAIGQPVITAASMTFEPGEQFSTSYCDSVGHGSAGADQVWDFSTLPNCDNTHQEVWAASTGTASFEYTVRRSFPPNSIMDFYTGTSDLFQMVADAPLPNDLRLYTDPKDIVHFPMAFGDTFFDTYSGQRLIGTAVYDTIQGSRRVTYDAHGTLTLPWGTISNAYRLHSQDTVHFTPETYLSRITDAYDYYQPGLHQALLSVRNTTYLPTGTTSSYSTLYVPSDAGVEENAGAQEILLYPDPVTGGAVLRVNERIDAMSVFDLSGRPVHVPFTLEGTTAHMDATAIASGIYTVVVTGPNGQFGRRFVKE